MKFEDLIQKSLMEFSEKENRVCRCKSHNFPIPNVDISIEGCGTLAFTVCWYPSQHRITIENFMDLSICRNARKHIMGALKTFDK